MFTRIPSKQDSKGKMKTEYTDGYFTKRTSKMRGPEFLEDIDQPYEGR